MITFLVLILIINLAIMYLLWQHLTIEKQVEIKEKFLGNNQAKNIIEWKSRKEKQIEEEKEFLNKK